MEEVSGSRSQPGLESDERPVCQRDNSGNRGAACRPVEVLALLAVLLSTAARAQSATEYQVKAAFLFNFAKFVEWPADAFSSPDAPLQICLLGPDPFGPDFEQLIVDKVVNAHRIEVIHPSGIAQARSCHLLFIALSDRQALKDVLLGMKGASVLTVGDQPGFAKMGGMINFVLEDNRVRFEINLKAAEQAHLKLSARLLTVAKLVLNEDNSRGN